MNLQTIRFAAPASVAESGGVPRVYAQKILFFFGELREASPEEEQQYLCTAQNPKNTNKDTSILGFILCNWATMKKPISR